MRRRPTDTTTRDPILRATTAASGVNNTTRELGGTLGVAVFGSIFASSYAPKIISAFRRLPIPAGPKTESHQSVAAAIAVIHHAPHAVRPALEAIVFHAFHSGLEVACLAGAGVALLGAAAAFRLLPGREKAAEVALEPCASDERCDGVLVPA